jgi:O-antigen/teichoic acid export membrane protein
MEKHKDLDVVKSRSFVSVASLLAQGSYTAVLGFAAFFILTIKSGVYLLGIYNTVLAALASFNYFTNLGLAAALMQKKEVRQIDLNTAFYIQFALTCVAVIIGYAATPLVFHYYKDIPPQAVNLYWAVLASFFILSLKTIPSVLLEKDIKIYKVVIVQALEGTVFYLIIIAMVFLNFDIESLVVAVLARALLGTILIYFFSPWVPTFSFSWKSGKELLRYGIPFQSNSFLAFFKDDLLILYLGGAIGLTNLGYVTFAKKYAEFSIRLIMDNINRVAFPLFARFQSDKELLRKSLEKVLYYETISIFALVVGAMMVFDTLLKVVPGNYYEKWHLALSSFYFFSLSSLFVSLYSPLINLFNAVGKVKKSLLFMLYFTILTWVLIPPMIMIFGYVGISYAFFVMSLSFFLVLKEAKKIVSFSLRGILKDVIIAVVGMMCVIGLLRVFLVQVLHFDALFLLMAIVVGGATYVGILYQIKGKALYEEVLNLTKGHTSS